MFGRGFIRCGLILLMLLFLAGCAADWSLPDPSTGRFKTSTKLSDEDIKVKRVEDISQLRRLVVFRHNQLKGRTLFHGQKLGSLFYKAFVNMDRFGDVRSPEQVQELINTSGWRNRVGDPSSRIALHELSKLWGDFLVVDYEIVNIYVGNPVDMRIWRASDGQVLLHLRNKGPIFATTSHETSYYPALNAVMDWVDACSRLSRQ